MRWGQSRPSEGRLQRVRTTQRRAWGGLSSADGGVGLVAARKSGPRGLQRAQTGMGGHEAIEERIVRAELEIQPAAGAGEEGWDDEVAVAEALAPQIRLGLHASEQLGETHQVVGGGDDEQPGPVGHHLTLATN